MFVRTWLKVSIGCTHSVVVVRKCFRKGLVSVQVLFRKSIVYFYVGSGYGLKNGLARD